jgi:hypothetical protein
MGSNLLASGSAAVQQRSGVVCRRSKITVYHTPEGEMLRPEGGEGVSSAWLMVEELTRGLGVAFNVSETHAQSAMEKIVNTLVVTRNIRNAEANTI